MTSHPSSAAGTAVSGYNRPVVRKVNADPAVTLAWWAHWPLAVVLAVAGVLVFTNLHLDYLWSDEGDTAVLAKSILKFGVPTAWDGVTFTDSDFGARLNDDFVMVSHPWLQYYVTALSFAAFGESALTARVPFAALGLVTIILAYVLVFRATRNRWTAATAAALLTLSVQFLIYSRMSRHYTLNAALTCLLVLQFTRLDSWRSSLLFAGIGILLFHSHPIGMAAVLALGVLTWVHAPSRPHRPWFWRAAAIIGVFTLPWLVLARSGYAENTGLLSDVGVFLPRLGQYLVEIASVSAVLGTLVLLIVLRQRNRVIQPARRSRAARTRRLPLFEPDEHRLLIPLLAILTSYALAITLTQPRDVIWAVGMRYTPAVLPFMAMIAALLVARVSRHQWRPWVALFIVFGFTKVGRLTPWTFWEDSTAKRDPTAAITFHNPERPMDRILRTGQLAFLRSLFEPNPGTTGRVVEYLNANAGKDDIVLTNYGWEPLYFHTGRPQGMTVLPSYPIYPAARERQLPDYVFGADGARWIVWRRAWGAYRGQALDRILAELADQKVPVALVATIPETLWENRENIHFRRFAGNRYVYPWYGEMPDTLIFRVDRPD